jgi:two-component system sensor histidine kinase UhpB
MFPPRSRQTRKTKLSRPSLLAQVLGVNAALITATVLAATLMVHTEFVTTGDERGFMLLTAALLATVLVNGLVLRRRFEPLERLIAAMESVDFKKPGGRPVLPAGETLEVVRLHQAFDRMLDRLQAERAQAASAVMRAQEEERARIARDLHDEANQALTGVLLRLQATAQQAPADMQAELRETQQAATQAIEELLRIARELRPSALDDHGLAAAVRSKIGDFERQTGVATELDLEPGELDVLGPEEQIAVYRVVQESLSNVAQHAEADKVLVALRRDGREVVARVADDGRGFAGRPAGSGIGLTGMRERAMIAGGTLDIVSAPGRGTVIELRIGGHS